MKKTMKGILYFICAFALVMGVFIIPYYSKTANAQETQTSTQAADNLIEQFTFDSAGIASLDSGTGVISISNQTGVIYYDSSTALNDLYTYTLTLNLNITAGAGFTVGVFVGNWSGVQWFTNTGANSVSIEFKGSNAKVGGVYKVGVQVTNASATLTVSDIRLVEKPEEAVQPKNFIDGFGFTNNGNADVSYDSSTHTITVANDTHGDFWFYSSDALSQDDTKYKLTMIIEKTSGAGGFIAYVGDWKKNAGWNIASVELEFTGSDAYITGSGFRVGFQVAADATVKFSNICLNIIEESHNLVQTAQVNSTCTTDGHKAYYTCSVCGLIFEDSEGKNPITYFITWLKTDGLISAGHVLNDGYSKDDTTHWNTCKNCSEKVNETAHAYDQEVATAEHLASNATCTAKATYYKSCVCGKNGAETFENGEMLAHDYATVWSSDNETHWHACTVCGAKTDETAHAYDQEVATAEHLASNATCTAKATYYKSCVCGKNGTETFENGEMLAHDYATVWSSDNETHWHACTVCGAKTDETAHAYDQEVATAEHLASNATCTAKATYYKSCVCGKNGTETFENGEMLAHSYSTNWSKDSTKHWHVCTVCGAKGDESEHSYGEWKTTKEATTTETGVRTKTCVCGQSIEESIPVKEKTGCGSNITPFVAIWVMCVCTVAFIVIRSIKKKKENG